MNNEIELSEKNTENNINHLNAQIVSVGVTTDNVYKVQLLLAPEIDMSTLKITVKSNNLRVKINRSLNYHFNKSTDEIIDGIILKKILKHTENFLIPNFIDSERVRASVNHQQRLLTLTAPSLKNLKNDP